MTGSTRGQPLREAASHRERTCYGSFCAAATTTMQGLGQLSRPASDITSGWREGNWSDEICQIALSRGLGPFGLDAPIS